MTARSLQDLDLTLSLSKKEEQKRLDDERIEMERRLNEEQLEKERRLNEQQLEEDKRKHNTEKVRLSLDKEDLELAIFWIKEGVDCNVQGEAFKNF